jgi:Mn2+/Fe2+ NRAMP family transporter
MFSTYTLWFDVSLITGITALGSIYFGHFELHTPKWRRVLKLIFFIVLAVLITSLAGRMWTYILLAVMVVGVIIVHGIILPSKGINGLTGEPKEKYYKFRGWEKHL